MENSNTKLLVWIIDDDEIYKYVFKNKISENYPLLQIQDFENGEEPIDFLKENFNRIDFPDVIFLDLNMPVQDGWGFLEEFVQLKILKNIKVYIVTSSTDQFDIDKAKKYSVVESFLIKPISPDSINQIFQNASFN